MQQGEEVVGGRGGVVPWVELPGKLVERLWVGPANKDKHKESVPVDRQGVG